MGENEVDDFPTPELPNYKLRKLQPRTKDCDQDYIKVYTCADKGRSSRANSSAGALSLPKHDYPFDRPITASFCCRKGPRGHWLRPKAKLY